VANYNFEVSNIQATPKGAELDNVLEKWLLNIITMEETQAKLKIAKERMDSFDKVYSEFAPLGSNMKKLEREIYIKKEDYLQNLHSLNMAILHQQSLMMSTDLTIIDEPIYPTDPDPSKRLMLVAVAFIAGITFSTGFVLALAYFDRSLKSPTQAAREIGLEILGALPRFPASPGKSKFDLPYLQERSIGLMLQQLYMDLNIKEEQERPLRVLLLSMRKKEGKTFLGRMMVDRLREYGKKVLYLSPKDSGSEELLQHQEDRLYPLDKNLYSARSEETLLPDMPEDWEKTDFIFTELPALLEHSFPVDILKRADYILLLCRANRIWIHADRKMLAKIKEIDSLPIGLVLNGVEMYYLESTLGDVPRKRGFFRKFLKRLFTLDFYSKNTL